jgi:hypothetical protein
MGQMHEKSNVKRWQAINTQNSMVSYVVWRTQIGGVWEQGAEENICTSDEWNDRRVDKKLHNKEFHDLYSSPNIIGTIKLSTKIQVGHLARMEMRNVCGVWEAWRFKRSLGDTGVDDGII